MTKFKIVKTSDGHTKIIRCVSQSHAGKCRQVLNNQQIEVQCFDSDQIDRIIGLQIRAAKKRARRPFARVIGKLKTIGKE